MWIGGSAFSGLCCSQIDAEAVAVVRVRIQASVRAWRRFEGGGVGGLT